MQCILKQTYLRQVQKTVLSSEKETPETLTDVEMKYLKWFGDDMFRWPLKDDFGLMKPHFIFDGPIQTLSEELQEKCANCTTT